MAIWRNVEKRCSKPPVALICKSLSVYFVLDPVAPDLFLCCCSIMVPLRSCLALNNFTHIYRFHCRCQSHETHAIDPVAQIVSILRLLLQILSLGPFRCSMKNSGSTIDTTWTPVIKSTQRRRSAPRMFLSAQCSKVAQGNFIKAWNNFLYYLMQYSPSNRSSILQVISSSV